MEGYYCEDCDNIMGIVEWMKHDPKHSGRHILWVFLSRRHIEKDMDESDKQEVLDRQESEDQEKLDESNGAKTSE